MSQATPFWIPALDLPLPACLHLPAAGTAGPLPLVILVHGFKGFMDWGPWPWLAEALAGAGQACLRFNFSHNGIGAAADAFTELDRFQANTFSREVAELEAVLQAAAALPGIDPTRITLVGHSLGGAIALLAAARCGLASKVVTWAGVADLGGLLGLAGQTETWRRDGFLEVSNARTGQIMRVGVELLEDWEANRPSLDVAAAMASLLRAGRPVTAIHGDQDPVVALDHGQRLQAAGAQLVVVAHGNHTFGAVHPFQAEPPPPLLEALRATLGAL